MKDDRIYLLHIRDAIDRVLDYIAGGKAAFFGDRKTQDAVVRNLEVIGEAVKNLSENLRSEHPQIPWKRIAGMRDKMIHEYFGIDQDLVWEVVDRELKDLKGKVQTILQAPTGKDEPQR